MTQIHQNLSENPDQILSLIHISVEIVDQVHQFLWGAITGSGGKISGYLVSPGGVQRMLRNSHQFHVGVAHLLYIGGQFMGRLGIGVKPVLLRPVFLFPGTQMDLINAHGMIDGVFPAPFRCV